MVCLVMYQCNLQHVHIHTTKYRTLVVSRFKYIFNNSQYTICLLKARKKVLFHKGFSYTAACACFCRPTDIAEFVLNC